MRNYQRIYIAVDKIRKTKESKKIGTFQRNLIIPMFSSKMYYNATEEVLNSSVFFLYF